MATGIAYERFDDPLFQDLLAVSYINARCYIYRKDEPTLSDRVLDKAYLATKGLEKVDIDNAETRKMLFSLGFNFSKLGDGGYISEQIPAVEQKCLKLQKAGVAEAYAGMAIACVACLQFILQQRPEFVQDIKQIAGGLMYAAEQDGKL